MVTCDQYPYRAGSTFLAAALPPHIQAKGPEVFAEKLKAPAVRQAIINEIEGRGDRQWENLIKGAGFENIIICISQRHEKYIGKSIAEIAKIEAKTAYDVFSPEGIFQFTTTIPGHILGTLNFKNGFIYALKLGESGFINAVRYSYLKESTGLDRAAFMAW